MKQRMEKVYNVVRDDDHNNRLGKFFDGFILALIVLTVIFLILDSFEMPAWFGGLARWFEVVSVVIFTAEYALRVWTAPMIYPVLPAWRARVKYAFTPLALIDLVSILPFYLPFFIPLDLRALRLFRLMRVFKFTRYTYALYTIIQVFKRKSSQLLSSMFGVLVLMVVASILLYNLESEAQPEVFSNALSGIWWALSVITGAWYGDIYPITLAGRTLGAAMALLSVALVAVPTGIISAGFVEVFREEQQADEEGDGVKPYLQLAGSITEAKKKLDKGHYSREDFKEEIDRLIDGL